MAVTIVLFFWLRAGRGRFKYITVSHGGWYPVRPIYVKILSWPIDPRPSNIKNYAASGDISYFTGQVCSISTYNGDNRITTIPPRGCGG